MQIWRARSIDDVFSLIRSGGGRLKPVAGATTTQLDWAKGAPKPEGLIDLSGVSSLKGLSASPEKIWIGALSTLANLGRSQTLHDNSPLLSAAIRTVAGPSIRNMATIGGNIANRNGCLLPALLALEANLVLATPGGQFVMPIEEWLAGPFQALELIIAIELPLRPSQRWTWRKIGLRAAFTPSVVNVAGILAMDGGKITGARLAVGGGVTRPQRLHAAENLVIGRTHSDLDWGAIREALIETIDAPDDDFRSGRYRRLAAANALVHGLGGVLPTMENRPAFSPPTAPGIYGEITLSRAEQPNRWHVRPDMRDKVEGKLSYLTDRRDNDMLVGRILRAGVPHARILSIDTSLAEALPGVVAVVTHRDIHGDNAFGIVVQDQPALCADKVRYVGDAVAAVAAVDAETAEKALSLIRVDYEPLPLVTSPEQALQPDAPAVHETGNLQREINFSRGDVASAFARAAHVVEDVYVTPRQMHGFMETEGGYARIEDDGTLLVAVGGQHGGRDRMQLSRILAMPEEKIRVITSPTGGAFGGKDELTVQPALALLALKSGHAVRLQLSRAESVLAGQKRNPMTIRMRTACDAEGRLVAQEVDVLSDAGAYASLGPGVLETALEHAAGPYVVANVATRGRLAYTNNGVCGAFRGFGANQMTYAIECQMDRLAALAGLDTIEIRVRNLREPGTPGYLGQEVAPSERIHEMLAAATASPIWRMPSGVQPDGEWVIGAGMALNYQGNGLGSLVPDPAGGRISFGADGMIEAAYGLDEMGQGLLTAIKSVLADELGCSRDDVRPVTGDTSLAPESGSTTASRGSAVVWLTARKAAPEFSVKMRNAAAQVLDRDPDSLTLAPGGIALQRANHGDLLLTYRELAERLSPDDRPSVTVEFEFPKNSYSAGNARYIFAFGAALARVAVSRVTGEICILDLHQHTAAGPVIDVAAYLGQMEGGAVQGLGFTLTEDATMRDGRYLTGNLDSYMLPGIQDSPAAMKIFALESLDDGDELGPRGPGELGIGAITPAIANALAAISGVWPSVTPFSPEAILAALEAA
jgi:xanthine dehydrogenase D subunit/xanthine dehydrogenase C subunit